MTLSIVNAEARRLNGDGQADWGTGRDFYLRERGMDGAWDNDFCADE